MGTGANLYEIEIVSDTAITVFVGTSNEAKTSLTSLGTAIRHLVCTHTGTAA